VTGVTFALLTRILRRRTQYLVAFVGMTVIFAVWTAASANYAQTGNSEAASAVVAMIFIYYVFYTIMHPLTYIYITEVFPFVHRAKGVGLTQTFSRAGSAFNQFVNPIGLGNIGWKFYIVYVVRKQREEGRLRVLLIMSPHRSGSPSSRSSSSLSIRRRKAPRWKSWPTVSLTYAGLV